MTPKTASRTFAPFPVRKTRNPSGMEMMKAATTGTTDNTTCWASNPPM